MWLSGKALAYHAQDPCILPRHGKNKMSEEKQEKSPRKENLEEENEKQQL
jgi:hypothetical protein